MSIWSGQDMLEEFLRGYLGRQVVSGDYYCETTEQHRGEIKTEISFGALDGLLVPAACSGSCWQSPFSSSQSACSSALQNFGRLLRMCILAAREAGVDLPSKLPADMLAIEGQAAATGQMAADGPYPYTEVPPPPPLPAQMQHMQQMWQQQAAASCQTSPIVPMPMPMPNPQASNGAAWLANGAANGNANFYQQPNPQTFQPTVLPTENFQGPSNSDLAQERFRSTLQQLNRREAWQDRRKDLNEAIQRYLDRAIQPDDFTWEFEGGGAANYVATLHFTFAEDRPKGPGWRGLPAANKGKAKASTSCLAYDWLIKQMEEEAADEEPDRPQPTTGQQPAMPPVRSLSAAGVAENVAHLQEDRNWSGLLREFMQGRLRRLLTEDDLKLVTIQIANGQQCRATVNYKGLTIVETSAVFPKKKEAEREACAKLYLNLMRQLQEGRGR